MLRWINILIVDGHLKCGLSLIIFALIAHPLPKYTRDTIVHLPYILFHLHISL